MCVSFICHPQKSLTTIQKHYEIGHIYIDIHAWVAHNNLELPDTQKNYDI